jgi:type II secretory pathway component GspD/PulD (secretin)
MKMKLPLIAALMLAAVAHAQEAPAPDPAAAPVPVDPNAQAAAAAEAAAATPAPVPATPPKDIRQVQIQAWISETSEKGLRDVGVNLNFTRFIDGEEQSGSVQQVRTNLFDPLINYERVTLPTPVAPEDQLSLLPAEEATAVRNEFNSTLRDPSDESSANPGIQTRSGFGFTGTIVTDAGTIDSVFRSTERLNDIDLVSKPEVLVVDNGEAMVRAGGKVPYQNATANAYGALQLDVLWRDVGVNLNVVPQILPDNNIRLTLKQLDVTDVDRIENSRGVDLPVFAKRSQTGAVVVPNGQTLVIGGLTSRVVRRSDRKVPVIGSLPIIGMPFRSRETDASVTHLLVFVSPVIVDIREMNKNSKSAIDFWAEHGKDWENQDRVSEEIELMQSEL